MSAAAEKWARAQDLPQTEKAVLSALARAFSPRWGRSEPTQTQMANEIGVTRETVNRTLRSLEIKKVISIGTLPKIKAQWDRRFYTLVGFKNVAKRSSSR